MCLLLLHNASEKSLRVEMMSSYLRSMTEDGLSGFVIVMFRRSDSIDSFVDACFASLYALHLHILQL